MPDGAFFSEVAGRSRGPDRRSAAAPSGPITLLAPVVQLFGLVPGRFPALETFGVLSRTEASTGTVRPYLASP